MITVQGVVERFFRLDKDVRCLRVFRKKELYLMGSGLSNQEAVEMGLRSFWVADRLLIPFAQESIVREFSECALSFIPAKMPHAVYVHNLYAVSQDEGLCDEQAPYWCLLEMVLRICQYSCLQKSDILGDIPHISLVWWTHFAYQKGVRKIPMSRHFSRILKGLSSGFSGVGAIV